MATQTKVAENGHVIEVPGSITVRELAQMMAISPIEIIKELMNSGIMANINQQIDFDTATIIGEELGYQIVAPTLEEPEEEAFEAELPRHRQLIAREDPSSLRTRPPIITVMGHVDHGKTTLLDTIRKTRVVDGEAGGITQHIGAYQVSVGDRSITFLDTPGHAAFTAMRARGAQATDLAILVVAADDGVMPQTREAVEHARAAQVPIVVALNKIDKPNINVPKVQQELADIGLIPEEWGGDTIAVRISARNNQGIDDLLENILLVTELADLQANPNRPAQGTIVEGRMDKRRGVSATLLVQNGTLNVGDTIVVGTQYGRIRAMFNDRGKKIKKAGPSTPVSILGLASVPDSGDFFEAFKSDKQAKSSVEEKLDREYALTEQPNNRPVTLEEFFSRMQSNGNQTLNLIIKADVHGSLEPIVNSIKELEKDQLRVKVLSEGAGNISESDINLAVASGAIVIGFNVEIDNAAQKQAEIEKVDVRQYNIIYKLIDDVEKALKGMLEPEYEDRYQGRAEVRAVFRVKKQSVAGCYVLDGNITRSAYARVIRNAEIIHDSRIANLKRFTEDVKEVATGFECGINVEGFNNFKEGDVIETYTKERVN